MRRPDRPGAGVAAGIAAYALWGLFPLYFPLLEPAGVVALTPRQRRLLVAAGVAIGLNWGTYIYGVNSHHVVETSLGYFINPLVTVALAVGLLHERLRRAQWAAVAIG